MSRSSLLMQSPSDTAILILCAEEQTRWQADENPIRTAKQLVSIAGQPLLQRTVTQVCNWGFSPLIITHRDDLRLYDFVIPEARRWTCETFLSTRHLWKQRTIVLLGDVVYSPMAMYFILSNREPLMFFGRNETRFRPTGIYQELFAVTFNQPIQSDLARTLDRTCRLAEKAGKEWGHYGKLRILYELFANLPIGKFATDSVYFYPIGDWTEDIDCIQDYTAFQEFAVGLGWCHPIFPR